MSSPRHWSLGAKFALVGTPFLLLATGMIAALVWMLWQLDGGAAAVNEAGRMRMQAYRMLLSADQAETGPLQSQVAEFERSLRLLRQGDPERPLFVPWDDTVRQRFASVEQDWTRFRGRLALGATPGLATGATAFASHIDAFVAGIEAHLSRWTSLMHLLQVAMMGAAVIGAGVLVSTGYRFALEPVGLLKQTIGRLQGGDLGARVDEHGSTDEFGTLAAGFNSMAGQLQSMKRSLEVRVQEKTAQLDEKRERLEVRYEVTTLAAQATTLEGLASGFTKIVARIARAEGVALRWSDETNRRYLMLASEGLQPTHRRGATDGVL